MDTATLAGTWYSDPVAIHWLTLATVIPGSKFRKVDRFRIPPETSRDLGLRSECSKSFNPYYKKLNTLSSEVPSPTSQVHNRSIEFVERPLEGLGNSTTRDWYYQYYRVLPVLPDTTSNTSTSTTRYY